MYIFTFTQAEHQHLLEMFGVGTLLKSASFPHIKRYVNALTNCYLFLCGCWFILSEGSSEIKPQSLNSLMAKNILHKLALNPTASRHFV